MLFLYVLLSFLVCNIRGDDYYKLFGIAKDSSDREIRRAFKKLAVQLHPDKNPDDPEADSKFMKITRAYEVLKDAELRKRYDQFGDETPSTTNQGNWHSWNYYHDQFGLYDDDPEIVTLSQSDFEQSVLNSQSPWFVNFYSTQCSHCHHLAPTWRQVARTLKGAVRVGAVNCDEDWSLCRSEGIRSYPSLVLYPQRRNQAGDRSESALVNFALSHLSIRVVDVTPKTWDPTLSWLLFLCEEGCVRDMNRLLVAAMLTSLVDVGQVDCVLEPALCDRLSPDASDVILFHQPNEAEAPKVHVIITGTASELADQVLQLLPKPISLDIETFEDMLSRLQLHATTCWLVHFDIGAETAEDLEWRRLPALLPGINLAQVHCGRHLTLCNRLHIKRYPTFVLFKPGEALETFHGRISSNDVADFAADSCASSLVTSLDYDTFAAARRDSSSAWLVDFYAPWCPPCLRLLPQLRAASRSFERSSAEDETTSRQNGAVNFGTVDCTVHDALCRQQQITSYPTTVLFNGSNPRNDYHGQHTAQALQEFLEDALDPAVVELSEYSFHEKVAGKTESQLWMVDFFAPWCSPCQQLTPEWRKLAKMLRDLPFVRLGQVDCVKDAELCSNQGVRSYPTIRLYPLGSAGLDTVALFNGYQRDAASLRRWLFFFLPNLVEELTPDKLKAAIDGPDAWLVDFYAPWCGHCVAFEPEFILVAQRLSGRVSCGKVDCQRYRDACIGQTVRAYPTVLFYQQRGSTVVSSQSADQIIDFALARLGKVSHDEL